MIGRTLGTIRDRIESLAREDGRYYLVCARTGDRPVPADGLRFPSRSDARTAARATEQYRDALRRYDPQVPYYDIVVCEAPAAESIGATERKAAATAADGSTSQAPVRSDTDSTSGEDERSPRPVGPPAETIQSSTAAVVDFCHTIAGALFEAIAESTHDGLEDAVMETYLDVAERISDPDELCLRLIESFAAELDGRLGDNQQAAVLASAAEMLPEERFRTPAPIAPGDVPADPLAAACQGLHGVGLLQDYRIERRGDSPTPTVRTWTASLSGYAFRSDDDRVVTLPLTVELIARTSAPRLAFEAATRVDESVPPDWQVTVTTGRRPRGLARTSVGDRL